MSAVACSKQETKGWPHQVENTNVIVFYEAGNNYEQPTLTQRLKKVCWKASRYPTRATMAEFLRSIVREKKSSLTQKHVGFLRSDKSI
jgi:hypothetical protein